MNVKAAMRWMVLAGAGMAAVCCAAFGQVNPHTQIRWPAGCTAPNTVYSFATDTCITAGGGGGGVTPSPQFSMFYQPSPGTVSAAVGDPSATTDGHGNAVVHSLRAGGVPAGHTFTLNALATIPVDWTMDVTTALTALNSMLAGAGITADVSGNVNTPGTITAAASVTTGTATATTAIPFGTIVGHNFYLRQTKTKLACIAMYGSGCITPNLTMWINGDSTAQLVLYGMMQHFSSLPSLPLVGVYMIGGGGGGQAGNLAEYGGPLTYFQENNTLRFGFNIGCANTDCAYLHGGSVTDVPYNAFWRVGTGAGGTGLSGLNYLAYNYGNSADKILTFTQVTVGYRISPQGDTCNVLVNDAAATLGTMDQVGSFVSTGALVGGAATMGTYQVTVPAGSGKVEIVNTNSGSYCDIVALGVDNPSAQGFRLIGAGTPGSGMGQLATDPNNMRGVLQAVLPKADLVTMTWKDNQAEGATPFTSQLTGFASFANQYCTGYDAVTNPNACDLLMLGTWTDTTETDAVVLARNAAMRAAVIATPNAYYWDGYYNNGSNASAIARNYFLARDQSTSVYQHYGPQGGKVNGDTLWDELNLNETVSQRVGHSYTTGPGSYASPSYTFISNPSLGLFHNTAEESLGVLGPLHLYNSVELGQPTAGTAPVVTAMGTLGATTYAYTLCGYETNFNGSFAIGNCSAATTITNGNAVLSATNGNMISWVPETFTGSRVFSVFRGSTCVAQAISRTISSLFDQGQSAGCTLPTAIQQQRGVFINAPAAAGVTLLANTGVNGSGANLQFAPATSSVGTFNLGLLDTTKTHGITLSGAPVSGTTSYTFGPTSGDAGQWFWTMPQFMAPSGSGATRSSNNMSFQNSYNTGANTQTWNISSQSNSDGSIGYIVFTPPVSNKPTFANFLLNLLANATNGTNQNSLDFQRQFAFWDTASETWTFHSQVSVGAGTTPTAYETASCTGTGSVTECGIAAPYLKATTGLKVGSQSVTSLPLAATLTTTAAASDNLTVTGMTSSGHCSLTATNASAATNTATTYVSAKATNQITVTHTATASMTYDVLCLAY